LDSYAEFLEFLNELQGSIPGLLLRGFDLHLLLDLAIWIAEDAVEMRERMLEVDCVLVIIAYWEGCDEGIAGVEEIDLQAFDFVGTHEEVY
jgi:hypothetical protein